MTTRPSVPAANDGSTAAPYLRTDFNMGNLSSLPETSKAPRGDLRAVLSGIKAAGYRGVQGGDAELPICRELGLGCTTGWRVNKPGEAAPMIATWKKAGFEIATLHVGWGHESDAEADVLVREIIAASRAEGLPVFIETHRATITQDTWRTVKLIERNPDRVAEINAIRVIKLGRLNFQAFFRQVKIINLVWRKHSLVRKSERERHR